MNFVFLVFMKHFHNYRDAISLNKSHYFLTSHQCHQYPFPFSFPLSSHFFLALLT